MNWTVLWEAVKEPLRLLVLGIIAWLITYVLPGVDTQWSIPLIVLLRFIDKWLHEAGKASDNATLIRGITQF
jgi:hypothetical protein